MWGFEDISEPGKTYEVKSGGEEKGWVGGGIM